MKLFILAALILFAIPVYADSMAFDSDKQLHFNAGVMIGGISTVRTKNKATGLKAAAWAGIAKEAYDYSRGGSFSIHDVAWTYLGGFVGVHFGGLIIAPNSIRYGISF